MIANAKGGSFPDCLNMDRPQIPKQNLIGNTFLTINLFQKIRQFWQLTAIGIGAMSLPVGEIANIEIDLGHPVPIGP